MGRNHLGTEPVPAENRTDIRRWRQDITRKLSLLPRRALFCGLLFFIGPAHPATLAQIPPPPFVVNSTADAHDGVFGDGRCDTGRPGDPPSGICTLRAALDEAERDFDENTIHFNIPGSGVPKIRPIGMLGNLGTFRPVTIDGTTQPAGLVELDGSLSGPGPGGAPLVGFVIVGRATTVRGLVINGFGSHGILIRSSGGSVFLGPNVIEGNLIGTDPTGMLPRGNGEDGVRIVGGGDGSNVVRDNRIGGVAGGSNVISGNAGHGVHIDGADARDNFVQSNFIGTNINNSAPLPNALSGVFISGGAVANTIGGPVTPPVIPPGNVIGGNDENGIEIVGPDTTDNFIEGNVIGGLFGNRLHGVLINGSSNNVVGDRAARDPKKGNKISHNGGDGVRILGAGTLGVWIAINSIFENGGLGIDLGGDGVTVNDPGDGDAGPNTLQNFPELIMALPDGTVTGAIHGMPATALALDFYSSNGCDSSGFGEGETFFGTKPVVTDGNGDAVFTFNPTTVPAGLFITALAYNPASENFSEFSRCIAISPPPPPPCPTVVTNTNDSGAGSLRSAIECANARPGADMVRFDIPGPGAHTIAPTSALPAVTDPATIDGYSQPGSSPNTDPAGPPGNTVLTIELDGSGAGAGADGLKITAGSSTARGLAIHRFSGRGILLQTGGGNLIEGNFIGTDATGTAVAGNSGHGVLIEDSPNNGVGGSLGNLIRGNGGAGIAVRGAASDGNAVRRNSLVANGGLGIDLADDGITPNDAGDADSGPNELQNFPILEFASIVSGAAAARGTLNSAPSASYTLEFFNSPICDPFGNGEGLNLAGSAVITTDGSGNASFSVPLSGSPAEGSFITATATAPNGSTSEFSVCAPVVMGRPYYTITPCRIADTRDAAGRYGAPALTANTVRVFSIAGQCGIPADARAVAVNYTVTQPAAQGHLSFYPADVPLPPVSTINYGPNQTRSNNAVTPLSAAGEVAAQCVQAFGTVHLIIDVVGFFK